MTQFNLQDINTLASHVCHHALLAHRAYVSKEAARLAANEALDIVEALHSEQVFKQVANQAGQLMKSNDLL